MRSALSGLRLTHVTFYRCFDRPLGAWIIYEFWIVIWPLFFSLSVIKARVIASSFDSISRERTYVVKIITVYRSLVKIRKRQEIHVQNDDCHCPYLSRGQLYVIMGAVERISRTEVRLMIPTRPYVRIWDSNMHTKYRSLSGICDK